MTQISIVIAVYRSHDCLVELNRQLLAALEEITTDFEIIYVEDHGEDGSWEMIEQLSGGDKRVKGVKLCRNFGQHYALSAGLDLADGEHVVLMDADLQDPPAEIHRLYERALQGHDVVLARRLHRTSHALNRLMGAVYYRVFDFLTGTRTDPTVGTFRILSRKVVLSFRDMHERHRFLGGMIQWMGYSTTYVDVMQADRFSGGSSYSLRRRLALAVDGILSFSNKPLILMVKFGFALCAVTFLISVWIVYRRLSGQIEEIGYASIMVAIFFLAGVTLLSVGVVGAYVGRIYDQVKQRPYYLVERTTLDV